MSSKRIDIPNHAGWSEGVLEDLCSVVSRGTAPVYVEDSAVRAIGQRCVAARGFRAELARPHSEKAMNNVLRAVVGDVLLNSTGTGTIGRSCVFDDLGTFIVDGHVTALRAPDYETGVWLDAVLRTPWAQGHLERFCYSGSTNQIELNNTALRETSLPLPDGKERKGIAKALSAVDALIKVAEISIEKLKQVKQGLLHDLLTRGIGSNGELRPTLQDDPSKYTIGKLGALPCSWSAEQVHHVLRGIEAGKSPDCEDTPAKGDEWGVLKVGAVNPEGFKPSENKVVKEKRLHNPAYLVREGDLLFSRANTYELVGLVSRVHRTCGNLMLSDKTLRLQVREGQMTATFLFWQLQHARSKSQIEIAATGTSGSMKNISQASLEKIWICRPPLEEQREIDARLAGIAKRCTEEEELLSKLRKLKTGITEDLLTGRVRVPSLLER